MNRPDRYRRLLPALGVFVLAAVLRTSLPQTIFFRHDQYRDVTVAREILSGKLVLEGPMVANYRNVNLGPLYYYVVAAGLVWRDQPVDAYRLLALLNAAGVAGFYLLMRRLIGARPALAAGVLLAIYPLALVTARALWNPTLILPTVVLYAAGLWLWVGERRTGGLGLLLVGAALMMQIHLSTLVLLPYALLGWTRRAPWRGRGAVAGAAIAAAITLPWLIPLLGAMFAEPPPGSGIIASFAGARRAPYETLSYPAALLRTVAPEPLLDGLVAAGGDGWRLAVRVAGWVFAALVVLGVLGTGRASASKAPTRTLLVGGVFVSAALLAALPHLFVHYLDVVFPFRVALAVLGVAVLARRIPRPLAVALLVVSVATGFAHWGHALGREADSGLIRKHPDYFDLFRVPGGESAPTLYPTLDAMQKVGRILSVDLGLRAEDLAKQARGAWWLSFLTDVGFWMDEPIRRGRSPSARLDSGIPLTIRHRSDPVPAPAPSQRRATHGAGPFTVITLESGLDRDSLAFHLPGHNRPGEWIPCRPAVKGRVIPDLPFDRVHLRMRLVLPTPPPPRVFLVLQRPEDRPAFARVLHDGTELRPAGSWPMRSRFTTDWFAVENPGAGEHWVEFHVERAAAEKLTVHLDVIDIWATQ